MMTKFGLDKLIHLITILLVAIILPVSCIVHCHVTTPVPTTTPGFYVCHPFTTVDAESPHLLHGHTVALRATHEMAILFTLALVSLALRSTITIEHLTHSRWYPRLITPPPRERLRSFAVAYS